MRPRRNATDSSVPDPGAAEGGFTLVELAVVVGIVALLLAVAIPQLVPSILFSTLEGS
ncbi:MAG TPA: prepilin-type N-terminal cleavage/methylation domain-containing protein, partial [Candidatus Hydrogenedentes bacterium]|nr:prepilin-type N-terminal cleavage/methylation domain-containing protein [Candidatus Hydrogenedentota bacterium]